MRLLALPRTIQTGFPPAILSHPAFSVKALGNRVPDRLMVLFKLTLYLVALPPFPALWFFWMVRDPVGLV
ncbi:hypothetical protein P168DRAFT_150896 [Aspergillus campestris IBT 28561]|uniref:Uncharacterized protein n=1 Tax=Aspergillus campestris (strain IBT 28561) TaxID=1392248 RepID=A0A2I1D2D2_ASPC2|nr:uncharacterized protein P168DRAFT_150896 [Aspergillus campestris IBT 28561]PKY04042.1 hypothetical protein P168DRAFT_150896 [Aspergillus campestris IBT 28561]